MRKISAILVALMMVASFFITDARAATKLQYSKEDLKALTDFFHTIERNWEKERHSIDIFYEPMSEAEVTTFCLYNLYCNGEWNGTAVVSTHPYLKYGKEGEGLVTVSNLKKYANEILGYNLDIPDDYQGTYAGWDVEKGIFIIPPHDAPADVDDFTIDNIVLDNYGLIRVAATGVNPIDPALKTKYVMILKENNIPGRKSWQILFYKPQKRSK